VDTYELGRRQAVFYRFLPFSTANFLHRSPHECQGPGCKMGAQPPPGGSFVVHSLPCGELIMTHQYLSCASFRLKATSPPQAVQTNDDPSLAAPSRTPSFPASPSMLASALRPCWSFACRAPPGRLLAIHFEKREKNELHSKNHNTHTHLDDQLPREKLKLSHLPFE